MPDAGDAKERERSLVTGNSGFGETRVWRLREKTGSLIISSSRTHARKTPDLMQSLGLQRERKG